MMLLKSLTDTQHDLVMTDPNDYKRMGRYLGVIPFRKTFHQAENLFGTTFAEKDGSSPNHLFLSLSFTFLSSVYIYHDAASGSCHQCKSIRGLLSSPVFTSFLLLL